MFPDSAFHSALAEFESHHTSGPSSDYEQFLTIKDTWSLYRKPLDSTGLYEYKVTGTFERVPLDLIARVYLDFDYRASWDNSVLKVLPLADSEFDSFTKHEHLFHCFYGIRYPMMLANREYAFKMHRRSVRRKHKRYTIVLGESVAPPIPMPHISSRHVVVNPYRQRLILTPTENGLGTRLLMAYFEDPGGYIPQMAINWAAKTGLSAWISSLETACAKYPAYLLSKGKPPVSVLSEVALLEDDESVEEEEEKEPEI